MVARVPSKRRILPASKKQKVSSLDAERAKFFGPAPLLAGENVAAYNEFLQQVMVAVKPGDIVEQIWVHDYVYHDCEVSRLRGEKAKFINDAARDFLKNEILRCFVKEAEEDADEVPVEDDSDATLAESDIESDRSEDEVDRQEQAANELAGRWMAGDQDVKNEMQKIFAAIGRDFDEVIADVMEMAFLNTMEDVEPIDRKMMTEESRRNAVVREVDRHRAVLGLQLRRTSEQIHDAEYKVIEDKKGQS